MNSHCRDGVCRAFLLSSSWSIQAPSTQPAFYWCSANPHLLLPTSHSILTTAAPLWSSTLHATSWCLGKGFSRDRHGKVRNTTLQWQLRGQKGPCAMTETLGARPGIYMVICISADKKELSAPQLGWQYFFPHSSCLDISERAGAPQGHCKIEKTIKRS